MITKIQIITPEVLINRTAEVIKLEIKSIGTDVKKSFYVGYDNGTESWRVSCDVPMLVS
jgi:hypothetical protein